MSAGPWEPLSVDEVVDVLGALEVPWWVAGGWAVDLHVGRVTREHEDLDVLVLREHLPVVRAALGGWDLWAADPPGTLRPWPAGEVLPERAHDVWCRRTPGGPWCLQLMVDDAADGLWHHRRDRRVTRPVADLDGPASDVRRRVLAPEVQLLAKSAHVREKDEHDLAVALPHLSSGRRTWLADALDLTAPGHPWVDLVRSG